MARIHIVRSLRDFSGWQSTYCGMRGHKDGSDEFVTAYGDRFEALTIEKARQASCKRCLASFQLAKRVSI